jgi:hypothetical protein
MNVIEKLLSGNTLEVRTNARILCNAFTTQVASSLLSHCFQRDNNTNTDPRNALDVRNEQDERKRGQEVKDYLTDISGHDEHVSPYKIAQICDGLRYAVYNDLALALGPDTPLPEDVLQITTDPAFGKSYTLPMSLAAMLDFRIDRAGRVDERKLRIVAEEMDEDIEFLRRIMQEQAQLDTRRLSEMRPDVLAEANSFTDAYDFDAFDSLPKDTQQRIISKVFTSLNKENERLLKLILRGQDTVKIDRDPVPVTTLRKFVKNSLTVCEEFLAEAAMHEAA